MYSKVKALLGLGCVVVGVGIVASCGDGSENRATAEVKDSNTSLALEAGSDLFCPAGASFDVASRMCTAGSNAVGPFTLEMKQRCKATKSVSECESQVWDLSFARGIRGTGACMPGAAQRVAGVCVEGSDAYGPFTVDHVANCKKFGGGNVCEASTRWSAQFAESTLPPAPVNNALPWKYIAGVDYGMRSDGCGAGQFRAPRGGGTRVHKGVDILFPVGTTLNSPCAGNVETGVDPSGYGNYLVVVCRVPSVIAGSTSTFVSMLYGHLNSFAVGNGASVSAGQKIGTSGRSGNATSACVNPHVHFEAIVESTALRASNAMPRSMIASESMKESIATSEASQEAAAGIRGNVNTLVNSLSQRCLVPTGLRGTNGNTYGANIDPFLLLSCLVGNKPALQNSGRQNPFVRWGSWYTARTFDVNVGQR